MLRNLGIPVRPRARIVYHPEYVTTLRDAGARHAFDNRRPQRIIEQLYHAGVLSPSQVLAPEPATSADLELVHTRSYLEELREPGRLAALLFMQEGVVDDELLQSFLRQTGGTMLAAERAVRDRVPVFNLGGGFHHAQRDRAEGFCAINDIAVATRRLQHLQLARKVLVIDLDFHPGNGTALIFSDDESVFTLSVHGQSWSRVEQKTNNLEVELPPGASDDVYLQVVREALAEARGRFVADAVIYLAGADPHEDDALGDFEITEEGMLERDLMIWELCREWGTPPCVVLGGGYSPFAWTLAYNFVFSVLTGERIHPAFRPGNIRARYQRVKDRLTPSELRAGSCPDLDAAELDAICESRGQLCLFMGYYTLDGFTVALERYGFLDLLRERGFPKLLLSMNTTDPDRQMFRIHFDRRDAEHLLVELVLRYRTLVTPPDAVAEGVDETFRAVAIEWLLMQDPTRSFSLDRLALPGQQHPGLGLGRWIIELLRIIAERLDCQGLISLPDHYHNAYIYSKQMLFFDPEDQGYLEALKRDLKGLPLVDVSHAIEEGQLRDRDTGEAVSWEGAAQVMPVKPRLNAYFIRPAYARAVAAARERYHFSLVLPENVRG